MLVKVTGELGAVYSQLGRFSLGTLYTTPVFTGRLGTKYSYLTRIELGTTFVFTRIVAQVLNLNASNTLTLSQVSTRGISLFRTINQTIAISQGIIPGAVVNRPANNVLVLSGVATGQVIKNVNASNTLVLTQILTNNASFGRTVVQGLIINQSAQRSVTLNRNINQTLVFKDYYVKSTQLSGFEIAIPRAAASVISKKCKVILQAENQSIILPCPILGDSLVNADVIVLKRSLNNILYTYIKTNDLKKMEYSFILGRLKSLELRQFILNTLEKIIIMTNWKGEIWAVNILTNPVDLVPKSRYEPDRERVEVSLTFEGVKIGG